MKRGSALRGIQTEKPGVDPSSGPGPRKVSEDYPDFKVVGRVSITLRLQLSSPTIFPEETQVISLLLSPQVSIVKSVYNPLRK